MMGGRRRRKKDCGENLSWKLRSLSVNRGMMTFRNIPTTKPATRMKNKFRDKFPPKGMLIYHPPTLPHPPPHRWMTIDSPIKMKAMLSGKNLSLYLMTRCTNTQHTPSKQSELRGVDQGGVEGWVHRDQVGVHNCLMV